MKHLKRFNESTSGLDKEEVQEFCENYLAYLLDEGYEIFIKKDRDNSLLFSFTIPIGGFDSVPEDCDEFKWNEIKDHFIPFLIHLSNNYEINGKAQFTTNRTGNDFYKFYTIQEMIDDEPSELDCYLYEIEMSIK
jgi:hypothetical protein